MGRISVTRNALILTMEDLLVTAMMGTSLTGTDSLVQVSESVVTYLSKTIKKKKKKKNTEIQCDVLLCMYVIPCFFFHFYAPKLLKVEGANWFAPDCLSIPPSICT